MKKYLLNRPCPKCGYGGGEWHNSASTRLATEHAIERQCRNCSHVWLEATHDAPQPKKRSGFPIPSFFRQEVGK